MTHPYGTLTASAVTDNTITDRKLREAVIAACRELVQRGLAYGTSGNVSVRRNERSFFVSPTGMRYDALEPDDIPLMNVDGRWFGRRRPRSSAPTANKMRRTPASSSAAGIFPTRSPTQADHGD
jgi:hypothetical protein